VSVALFENGISFFVAIECTCQLISEGLYCADFFDFGDKSAKPLLRIKTRNTKARAVHVL
jgi:hypothetical protein